MNNFLVLSFVELSDSISVKWAIFNSEKTLIRNGQSSLNDIRDVVSSIEKPYVSILLVGGEDVRIEKVSIPTKNLNKIHQALPFLLEESIADDLENTHFAISHLSKEDSGAIYVGIVTHDLMINWIDKCHEYDIRADYIIPDSLCVPWSERYWSFLFNGDKQRERILFRQDFLSAQAFPASVSEFVVPELISSKADATPHEVVLYASQSDYEAFKLWAKKIDKNELDYREVILREDVFQVLASNAVIELRNLLNLRQGGYRVPSSKTDISRFNRNVALMLLGGCTIFLILSLFKGLWFDNLRLDFADRSASLYREIFPDAGRVDDPRRLMESQLSAGKSNNGGNSFLDILVDVTKVISSSRNSEVAIRSLRFDKVSPENLTVSMIVESEDVIDEMSELLLKDKIKLDVINAESKKGGYLIEFHVMRDL